MARRPEWLADRYRAWGGLPPPARLALAVPTVLAVMLAIAAAVTLLILTRGMVMPLIFFGLAAAGRRGRRHLRHRPPGPPWQGHHLPPAGAPSPPPVPPPVPPPAWPTAKRRYQELQRSYAAFECDPLAVLRLPALTDVTVPSTARFVEALAEAQALDSDHEPPPRHREAFVAAVDRACRAWQAARDAAERIRLSHLTPQERAAVARVVKLLTTAQESDSDAERIAAYARARSELARLEQGGRVRLPRPAAAALDAAARGQLPPAVAS